MKVLWFTNVSLSKSESKGSGSWLFAMKDLIKEDVDLYCISEGDVQSVMTNNGDGVQEFIIPAFNGKSKLPPDTTIRSILSIIEDINPDIIHIWGIEKYWIRLFEDGFCQRKYILEIQGLLSSCAAVFWGGLTNRELRKCKSVKEMIFPDSSLKRQYRYYIEKGRNEAGIFARSRYLSVQSVWTRNQLSYISETDSKVFDTLRPIRKEFYLSKKWSVDGCKRFVVFTSFSYSVPFKGLHILLKALSCIVEKYPNVELRIAGKDIYSTPFYLRNGYENYLLSLIQDLNIRENVVFLKSLNASSLAAELLSCNVFVNPSFVESYSAAAAEALYLGVPSVLSYAGALPDFSKDDSVALYYSPLDYVDCACKISKFFESSRLSHDYSIKAIKNLSQKCDYISVKERQLSIYESIINS